MLELLVVLSSTLLQLSAAAPAPPPPPPPSPFGPQAPAPTGDPIAIGSAAAAAADAASAPSAVPPLPLDAGRLRVALEKLSVAGSVLYIAAHPDDENTNLLSWLANERKVRAGYLSLTRGDGGQNLVGPELGDLLGVIRTQELLAARRVDGAEQFFTRARDFGFSKTPDETLAIWGRDAVLSDMVRVIRRFRPDVVVTRFPTNGDGGHGHHTASALLAPDAVRLAADPAYVPQGGGDTTPWQARRLLWNKSLWNLKPGEDLAKYLTLDIGVFSPLLGVSYGELSADSRSMHKSQGFGVPRNRGPIKEYFEYLWGGEAKPAVLDGLDLTLGRFAGTKKLRELLARAERDFRPSDPAAIVPTLLAAAAELEKLPDAGWRAYKQRELTRVIEGCLGLWAEATAAEPTAVPGGSFALAVNTVNRSKAKVSLEAVVLPGGTRVDVRQALDASGTPIAFARTLVVPADAPLGGPYWLADHTAGGLHAVANPALVGVPESPASLAVRFEYRVDGKPLTLVRPVAYKWVDPVLGERWRTFEIVPAAAVNPARRAVMFPDATPRPLRVRLASGAAATTGTVRLELPAGFTAEPASAPFSLAQKGDEAEVTFTVKPPATVPAGGNVTGLARVIAETAASPNAAARAWTSGLTRIEHAHIPVQTLFPDATVRLSRFELAHKRVRIGYIPGAGDEVAESLADVGYQVTTLDDAALEAQPLSAFDAIVVGIRAYNTNPRMKFHNARLVKYVEAGGTVVAQYNVNNRLSAMDAALGPFPLQISRERVTDETAAFVFENPKDPLWTTPNALGPADFEGWVQERGLYFCDRWDERWRAPLAMNDAGEPARKGGLLVGAHGKGLFIYTGLAFFRQLPAGVPGAYRLFANLLDARPTDAARPGATDVRR